MTIKIFTSLPPGMNRFNAAGDNIGLSYYRSCLQSWRDHGFEIVSVNSRAEPESPFEGEFKISRINLDRDAKDICGKPLVYFADFMKAIYDNSDGPFIITNADIELNICDADLKKIWMLERGTFMTERRVDYHHGKKAGGTLYIGGFDFFAMHRDDLKIHFDCKLAFGMPWWDHYLPVIHLALNFRHVPLEAASQAYHLLHDERWDMMNFRTFGNLYREELNRIEKLGMPRKGLRTMMLRIAETERKNIYYPYARRHNFLPNLLGFKPKDPELNRLHWIAFSNFRLIDQPDEQPLSYLSLSRFLQRLPF